MKVSLAIAAAGVAIAVGSFALLSQGTGATPLQLAGMKAPADADFYDNGRPSAAKVELGRLLFFDKILSGNKNIACATCHHPFAGSGDALSLPVGEGGVGLGVERRAAVGAAERVPRNAPPLFNLGAREFTRLFHDGRVAVDPAQPTGFDSPAGTALPEGLDNPLAVQALFPPTSPAEMAGQPNENGIGAAAMAGSWPVWEGLAARLRANEDYANRFIAVFDDVDWPADITMVHAANAIAAFEATAFRADNSPFDRYLRGEHAALTPAQHRGLDLFYGSAGCVSCHSGPFQTDHAFHAIAMPQIGPGKGDGAGYEDYGRERVSGNPTDRYRFRTPSLRNVALTGPWGHSGAFASLEAVVRHHLDAPSSVRTYDIRQAMLPSRPDLDAEDRHVVEDADVRQALAAANALAPVRLSDGEIGDLVAFLHALTDPASQNLAHLVPAQVPSGLPVAD